MLKFAEIFIAVLCAVAIACGDTLVFSDSLEQSLQADLIRKIVDTVALSSPESANRLARLERIGVIDSLAADGSITVVPAVRSIKIHAAFPLFRTEIEQVMTLRSGDFLTIEKLEIQRKMIVDRYGQIGIINPEITFRTEPVGKTGLVDLHVTVGDKEFQLVGKVLYRGTTQFGPLVHGWNFKAWHYKRFMVLPQRYQREDLRDDVRKLREFYRSMGYADAEISVRDSVTYANGGGHQVIALIVDINSGISHALEVEKVHPFRRSAVKNLFNMKKKGSRSASVIRSGTTQLKSNLEAWGYDSARVIVTDTTIWKAKRYPWQQKQHTVRVEVGSRKKVRSVRYEGVHSVPLNKVKVFCSTKRADQKKRRYKGSFSEKIFAEDCLLMESYLRDHGYPRATVVGSHEFTRRNRVAAHVAITENKPCTVSTISTANLPDSIAEEAILLLCRVKPGELWNREELRNDQQKITAFLRKKGLHSAEAQVTETFSPDSSSINLQWVLKHSVNPAIRSVSFWGNYHTRNWYLRRTAKLVPGTDYSSRNMNESVRKLRNSGLFSAVTPELIRSMNGDSVDILIRLEEQKRMDISGAIGFETEKGVFVRSSFVHSNLHGLNRKLQADAGWSDVERKLLLMLTEPNLFGSTVKATIGLGGLLLSEKNVDYQTRALRNSYTLGWNPRPPALFSLSASYLVIKNVGLSGLKVKRTDGAAAVTTDYLRHTITFGPEFTLDFRDSFMKPSRGFFLKVESTVSRGVNILSDDYWRIVGETKLFFSPLEQVTAALRLNTSLQRPYGKNLYTPVESQFRLGGNGSVRGFGENLLFTDSTGKSLTGMGAIFGSVELRPQLLSSLEIPLFLDFGSLTFTEKLTDLEPVRFTAGTGVRLHTPIGPIGVVYGWKLNRTEGDRSAGNYHFSIGYSF